MAGLTKQHFKAIAEIMKDNKEEREVYQDGSDNPYIELCFSKDIIKDLSNYFKTQNPLFNENQFKKACLS